MIQSIIDRLMETGTPFAISGGAAQLADVKDRPTNTPAVFVFISDERSTASERIGSVLQRTQATIGVVIVTENLSALNNAAAVDDIDSLKAYCRRKLIGFTPTNAEHAEPMEHLAGELQQALGGTVWFEDAYTTAYYLMEA
ncbi:hypothetical protein SAMN05892877_12381 [Rhizobium subbaraonis]|uniref:Uncharacterized protein n=1 Tax=Rhizobium subbaraonis TaxID=908946 RepID=A0A285UXU5_9HYPH|nr:hypothetical protein [Rhizobium subbaraonis]SOC46662.1 hypothetical protein SAMN05892877_12381 [Rhizobium subbaraonis]